MNVNSLYELSEYWRSDAPAKSLAQLNIPEMGQRDFLSRLNNAVQYREAKPSKMQLDTL